jgi:uncharacterized membrane protein HdeD (DUF308 family)
MTTASSSRSAVSGIRAALGIGGALAVILGILILVWPGRTAMVAVAIVAIYTVLIGLVYAALGIFREQRDGWSRVGHILLGVLFVLAGVFAFINLPAATAWFGVFIGVLIGVLWIIEGVVALSTLGDARSKLWTTVFAVLSIVAGAVLLFAPLWGAVVLWWMIGISAIVLGVLQIARASSFGR